MVSIESLSAEYLAGIEANRIEGETAGQADGNTQGREANQLDLGFSRVD